MPNRLKNSPNLYLRQHAKNPVDWWPWCPEALREAERAGKPVLVSIGYSACHWCHVMARESFQNEAIAKLMNRHFTCIKIDREEHPELDRTYMEAVQMVIGNAGWPLNVFCLTDMRPFSGGTYFPPEDRGLGMVPWPQLLMRVADFYRKNRDALQAQAEGIVQNLERGNQPVLTETTPASPASEAKPESQTKLAGSQQNNCGASCGCGKKAGEAKQDSSQQDKPPATSIKEPDLSPPVASIKEPETQVIHERLRKALRAICSLHDPVHGGFGKAPKFPQPLILEFLLLARQRPELADTPELQKQIDAAVQKSLESMVQLGLHDPIEGGFHRYSVDAAWRLPHFEKMLSDNALLMKLYTQAWQDNRKPWFEHAVRQTAKWLLKSLQSPEGWFCSSMNAESDGVEGAYYTLEPKALRSHLGPEAFQKFSEAYAPQSEKDADAKSREQAFQPICNYKDFETHQQLSPLREKVAALRAKHPMPEKDPKCLLSANALALEAFAEAGFWLGEIQWLRHARKLAEWLWNCFSREHSGGTFLFALCYEGSPATQKGKLEDYAYFARALLSLAAKVELLECGSSEVYLQRARKLIQSVLRNFSDAAAGFYFTAKDHGALPMRKKIWLDEASPSANAVLLDVLTKLDALGATTTPLSPKEAQSKAALGNTYAQLSAQAGGSVACALSAFAQSSLIILSAQDTEKLQVLGRIFSKNAYRFVFLKTDLQLKSAYQICTEHRCTPMETPEEVLEVLANLKP